MQLFLIYVFNAMLNRYLFMINLLLVDPTNRHNGHSVCFLLSRVPVHTHKYQYITNAELSYIHYFYTMYNFNAGKARILHRIVSNHAKLVNYLTS